MARAYSLDLREKVISFVFQGGGKRKAARIFGLGENTVYLWLRRHKSGDLNPKKRTDFQPKVSPEILSKYLLEHPDDTLKEIGQAVNLSSSKVWKHLKRLGITRKKRPHFMQNAVKKTGRNLKSK